MGLNCLLLTSDATLLEVIRTGFSATSVELEMRTDAASAIGGRVAVFSGASWGVTVSSRAKLRWSPNLKRDSRVCKSTSKNHSRRLVETIPGDPKTDQK